MEANEIEIRVANSRRKNKLDWYEREVMKTLNSVASLFRQLRDDPDKPYLLNHSSFEEYCLDRWKMTARRTHQLVAADDVRLLLLDTAPEMEEKINSLKEGQLRELVTTPEIKRVEVLKTAVALPGKMTARKIKLAKARVLDAETHEPVEPQKCCPACGQKIP